MSKLTLTNSATKRIEEITSKKGNDNKFLRISVSGGGCSGFQYIFDLDDKLQKDDIKITNADSKKLLVVIDETSLPFLEGSELNFVEELGASYFKVENPNATNNCGCGSSFSI